MVYPMCYPTVALKHSQANVKEFGRGKWCTMALRIIDIDELRAQQTDYCHENAHPQITQSALNVAGISLSQTGENAIPAGMIVNFLNLKKT